MMGPSSEDDLDLRGFDGVCRLFPLPDVVQFPHSILPLHIFEPRYRQMTEDALAGDGLVTVVRVPMPAEMMPDGRAVIEPVACLGRILQHERLPDGRFNFLLLGRKRVRLLREIPSEKLYRIAEAEILEDLEPDAAMDPGQIKASLVGLFRVAISKGRGLDPDLERLLAADLPLGVAVDMMAHALRLSPATKQSFLAEPLVEERADRLLRRLQEFAGVDPVGLKPFPPDFSVN
ncbi:LON peptidase substrate-binding domain-containing protein [Isosphaeraceae bacterium EP7]